MPTPRRAPRLVRRLVLICYGASLAGTISLSLYFVFIDLPANTHAAPGTMHRLIFRIVGLNTLGTLGLTLGMVYTLRGLQGWLDRLYAGLPPAQVPAAVRRQVLRVVSRLTMFSGSMWLLGAVIGILASPVAAGGLQRTIKLAVAIAGAGGALTVAVIYFAADLAWRPAVHAFFPDGRLSALSSRIRPMFARLLAAFLLTGVWLPALLVTASLSRSSAFIGRTYTEAIFHNLMRIEIALLTACVVASVALAVLVTRGITGPVRALQAAMARVERNDLTASVKVTTTDELGYLGERFNQMTAGLREREHIRRVLGEYVTTQVAEAILRGDIKIGGDRAEVTVLMTDLRDFTRLCERMESEALVALLNRYFDVMIDAILELGGTLDKFVGDGIVTVFNAPLPQDNHQARAVLTALRMREKLAVFNAEQQLRGEPELQMGIGIHSGTVVAGNVGSEGKRVEYTVMGDTVNVAARLEGLTKDLGSDVCLSDETFREVRDWVLADEPISTMVKGRRTPVTVYGLIGLRSGVEWDDLLNGVRPQVMQAVAV